MSSPQGQVEEPKLSPRKEPIGWNFEDIKSREEPIPDQWWFVPWTNIQIIKREQVADDFDPEGHSKLLLVQVGILTDVHKGTGVIIHEDNGQVVGCYKQHADTEDGDDTKASLEEIKSDVEGLENQPGEGQTVRELEYRRTIRRLNGLVLDARPRRIATHDDEVFKIHPCMTNQQLNRYGSEYLHLEAIIRTAMGNTFDIKDDLPLYRQKEIAAKKKAGVDVADFSDK